LLSIVISPYLLSLRAVVSAISAFLSIGTHCSYISHFNTAYCAVCVSEYTDDDDDDDNAVVIIGVIVIVINVVSGRRLRNVFSRTECRRVIAAVQRTTSLGC